MDILVYTPQETERFGDYPSSFIYTVLKKGKLVYDGDLTSLPLDGRGGLAADVVDDAVDTRRLIHNTQ